MENSSFVLAAASVLSVIALAPTVAQADAITNTQNFSVDIRNPAAMDVTIGGLVLAPGESISSLTLEFKDIAAAVNAFVPASAEATFVSNASLDLISAKFFILTGPPVTNLATVTLDPSAPNGGINVSDLPIAASVTDTVIDSGSWAQASTNSIVLDPAQLLSAGIMIGQPFTIRISLRQMSDMDTIVDYSGTLSGNIQYTYERTTGDIPEPASVIGLAAGMSGVLLLRRKK